MVFHDSGTGYKTADLLTYLSLPSHDFESDRTTTVFDLYAAIVVHVSRLRVCASCWSVAAVADDDGARAKTAPTAQQRRRQWQAGSIEVRTDVGSNIRIKAPG